MPGKVEVPSSLLKNSASNLLFCQAQSQHQLQLSWRPSWSYSHVHTANHSPSQIDLKMHLELKIVDQEACLTNITCLAFLPKAFG